MWEITVKQLILCHLIFIITVLILWNCHELINMGKVKCSLVTTVPEIPCEKMCTFSQKPKANPYRQPERCPGQSSLFDFSSEEPAAETQDMINPAQPWHYLSLKLERFRFFVLKMWHCQKTFMITGEKLKRVYLLLKIQKECAKSIWTCSKWTCVFVRLQGPMSVVCVSTFQCLHVWVRPIRRQETDV